VPEERGIAGLQRDNDVRVQVMSKHWEHCLGIRVSAGFLAPSLPHRVAFPSHVSSESSPPSCDAAGVYSNQFRRQDGGRLTWVRKLQKSAVKVKYFGESDLAPISCIRSMQAATYSQPAKIGSEKSVPIPSDRATMMNRIAYALCLPTMMTNPRAESTMTRALLLSHSHVHISTRRPMKP
jgi:hypothetical protein